MTRTVAVWVFSLLGEPLEGEHGTPYVQITTSETAHSTARIRCALEEKCQKQFKKRFPGHPLCHTSGWALQEIKVNRP